MTEQQNQSTGSGTKVTCDCGLQFRLDGPEEDRHYVWAVRRDGSRSMLGYCPVKHGMTEAVRRARSTLSGVAMFHGKVV